MSAFSHERRWLFASWKGGGKERRTRFIIIEEMLNERTAACEPPGKTIQARMLSLYNLPLELRVGFVVVDSRLERTTMPRDNPASAESTDEVNDSSPEKRLCK